MKRNPRFLSQLASLIAILQATIPHDVWALGKLEGRSLFDDGPQIISLDDLPPDSPQAPRATQLRAEPVYRENFVVTPGSYDNNHGSSLAELPDGSLLISWFAGTREGSRDSQIYASRYDPIQGTHSPQEPVVRSNERARGALLRSKTVGNSALYFDGEGDLWLFYNAVAIGGWSGSTVQYKISRDLGHTWSQGRTLIGRIGSLIRNPPLPLGPGVFLLPAYSGLLDQKGFSCRVVHKDGIVQSIACGDPIPKDGAIQPALARTRNGRILALLRDKKGHSIYRSWSSDEGRTWSIPDDIGLPNPDAALAVAPLDDGRLVVLYNSRGREVLSVAISADQGGTFHHVRDLENSKNGEFSYPALLQTRDGFIHAAYTYERKSIKHVIFDKAWLEPDGPRPNP